MTGVPHGSYANEASRLRKSISEVLERVMKRQHAPAIHVTYRGSQSIRNASIRCASKSVPPRPRQGHSCNIKTSDIACSRRLLLVVVAATSSQCLLEYNLALETVTRKLAAASIPFQMLRRLVALAVCILLPLAKTTKWDQHQTMEQHTDTDEITHLPGLRGAFKSRHHGGYITVDESHKRNLYYYFVTSENKPAEDPLVLWLNGGPGCSSFDGEFSMLFTHVLVSVGCTSSLKMTGIAKACN